MREFWADAEYETRHAFFAEFGEDAIYTSAAGTARTVVGSFELISEVQAVGEMVEMDGVSARLELAHAEVEELAIGDAMTVRGVAYRVVSVEPDGTGTVIAVLAI